jgi:glycerol-3-phosphate acyltransferase PlsY
MDPVAVLRAVAIVGAAYLIGGIPWGVIVARLSGGPDPRTIGSGRTGGANVMRALGPRLALISGILDMLKGTVAVLVALALGAGVEVEVLAGLAAIIGHSRSPFLGLSGGRGVSAAFGASLVIAPLPALVILVVFLVVLAIWRYTSLASLTSAAVGGVVFTVRPYPGIPLALLALIGAPVLVGSSTTTTSGG